jgi:hypothetical protein
MNYSGHGLMHISYSQYFRTGLHNIFRPGKKYVYILGQGIITKSREIGVPGEKCIGCIQKFMDWPAGVRTANGMALCH